MWCHYHPPLPSTARMHLAPRVLYGLHERFLLFPYVYGAPHCRLVLRAELLGAMLRAPLPKSPLLCAPLVLCELHSRSLFPMAGLIPTPTSGRGIHSFHFLGGATFYLRSYRARLLHQGLSIRFEAGTKTQFATHTQYYSLGLLRDLINQGGGTGEETSSTKERLPRDPQHPVSRDDGDPPR
jgi:hypothetical protein